jgi:hypothetical protein
MNISKIPPLNTNPVAWRRQNYEGGRFLKNPGFSISQIFSV